MMIMIAQGIKNVCKDYKLIENYEKAINDKENVWVCHHRNGILLNKTCEELKAMGLYYNRPPEELIFLTEYDHKFLHTTGKQNPMYGNDKFKGENNPMYNKNPLDFMTEEAKKERAKKISENNKGKTKCIPRSEEIKQKIRETLTERYKDPAARKKISEGVKAWWAKRKLNIL